MKIFNLLFIQIEIKMVLNLSIHKKGQILTLLKPEIFSSFCIFDLIVS